MCGREKPVEERALAVHGSVIDTFDQTLVGVPSTTAVNAAFKGSISFGDSFEASDEFVFD